MVEDEAAEVLHDRQFTALLYVLCVRACDRVLRYPTVQWFTTRLEQAAKQHVSARPRHIESGPQMKRCPEIPSACDLGVLVQRSVNSW